MFCGNCGNEVSINNGSCSCCGNFLGERYIEGNYRGVGKSTIKINVSKIITIVALVISVVMLILTCLKWTVSKDIYNPESYMIWNTYEEFKYKVNSWEDEKMGMIATITYNAYSGETIEEYYESMESLYNSLDKEVEKQKKYVNFVLIGKISMILSCFFIIYSVVGIIVKGIKYDGGVILFSVLFLFATIFYINGVNGLYKTDNMEMDFGVTSTVYIELVLSIVTMVLGIISNVFKRRNIIINI